MRCMDRSAIYPRVSTLTRSPRIAYKTTHQVPSTPLLRQPCQSRLERPATRVMVYHCRVNAAQVADFESLQVRLEGVSEKDWCRADGEEGKKMGLYFLEGGCDVPQGLFCNSRPSATCQAAILDRVGERTL